MDHGPQSAEFARPGGSRLDFEAVYRAHFDYVWTCLRRFGVADSALEDAAQEVFVVVHRRLGEFVGRAAVRTWLFAIARRVAFRFRRSAQRAARRHHALAHRQVDPPAPDPDDAIRDAQARRRLAAFLAELDDDKRAAFLLGELEGLGREELGRALGINPNTAYARLRAARQQFLREFAEPTARAAALACGRVDEPAPADRRNRVWLLLGLDLDLDAPIAAAPASASLAAGLKLLVAAGALTVLTFMVQRTGPPGQATLAPVTSGAREHTSRLAAAPAPEPPELASPTPTAAPTASGRSIAPTPAAMAARRTGGPTSTAHRSIAPTTSPAPLAPTTSDAHALVADMVPRESPAPASPPSASSVAAPGPLNSQPQSPEPGGAPAIVPPLPRPTPAAEASLSAPAIVPGVTLGPSDATPTADPRLAADVRLLGQARRALADDRPADARTHLEQHAARFPDSPLRAARQAMRVSVLCRLGERAAAEREAASFLRAHPESGLADQVRDGCLAPTVTRGAEAGD